MAATPVDGTYPEPVVKPELFTPAVPCNTALPVGEVIEWFDFGQFVELFATDASGASHPLVLTQDDAVLQATLRVREGNGTEPTRDVDLSGGVPLNRVAAGEGSDAFKPLAAPKTIVVADVDELVARGSLTSDGVTYEMMLQRSQIEFLRDGEPVVMRVREISDGSRRRAWVQLAPDVADVKVANLDQLLADPRVSITREDGEVELVELKLEPLETAALMAERTVVVRGTVGAKTRLVRLRQREGVEVGFATRPAADEYVIKDLAGFLTSPVVPGADGLPFKVPLVADDVRLLRAGSSTQVDVGGGHLLTLRLETAP